MQLTSSAHIVAVSLAQLHARKPMAIYLRPATLDDVAFLADVVITATVAQGRFPHDVTVEEYRAGYEDWTRETITEANPDGALSVIECDGTPVGRMRVVHTATALTLAGIQILPSYQNQGIGTTLIERLKREAAAQQIPLHIGVEKDNPRARRLYERLGCDLIGEDDHEYKFVYRPAISQTSATS
jgi:ribosomal protein S18 acetylase RimI-like enzyme